MSAAVRYVVRCDDYTTPTKYPTRADAERAADRIERQGACRLPHRIEAHAEGVAMGWPASTMAGLATVCGEVAADVINVGRSIMAQRAR